MDDQASIFRPVITTINDQNSVKTSSLPRERLFTSMELWDSSTHQQQYQNLNCVLKSFNSLFINIYKYL